MPGIRVQSWGSNQKFRIFRQHQNCRRSDTPIQSIKCWYPWLTAEPHMRKGNHQRPGENAVSEKSFERGTWSQIYECDALSQLCSARDAEGSKRQSAKPNAGRSARTQRNPQKRQEQGEGKSISTEMLGQLPNLTGTGHQSKETSVERQKNRADIYKQTPITVKTKFIVWLQAFNCLLQ